MTYVVIPAYNEQATIRPVVDRFLANPHTNVVVIIDRETKDTTFRKLPTHGRLKVIQSQYHGKGQNITLALRHTLGNEVVLCDADVTISPIAVRALMMPLSSKSGQRIVVPRHPSSDDWRQAEAAAMLKFDRGSWPWVSGIRRIRAHLIPPTVYGYLTEVLINRSVNGSSTPYTHFINDPATISPLRFSPERINDLHAHGKYGKEKGLI